MIPRLNKEMDVLESHGLCGSGFQFSVQAGLILVQGAHPEQAFQCGSFQPCQLHVISDLPFESEDRVMIVAPPPTSTNSLATVCGRGTSGLQVQLTSSMSIWDTTSTSPAIFTTTLAPNETTTTLEPRPSHYVGEFHLESAGQAGLYRICYCKHSVLGPCDDPVAFAQWAGVLMLGVQNISGRVQYEERIAIHQQCLASARCYFNITGVWAMQLSFSDSFRAVPLDVACDTEADSSSYPKFSLLRRSLGRWSRCVEPGATCELLVHGWRMDLNDAVRLVSPSFVCGEKDPHEVFLGAGFDENPSLANRTANTSDGVLLHFDLGRARGSGRWKVCLCVAAVAKSRRNCSEASDYGQQVGELLIEGLLRSVTPSSQPSTMQMASVLVDVIEPGSAMSVACAASNQSLDQAPLCSNLRFIDVFMTFPSGKNCSARECHLLCSPHQGYNILHIPLLYNGPAAEAHVWCTGDVALCMTGRCVLPPTPNGLRLSLNPGPDPWTELHAAIGEDLELQERTTIDEHRWCWTPGRLAEGGLALGWLSRGGSALGDLVAPGLRAPNEQRPRAVDALEDGTSSARRTVLAVLVRSLVRRQLRALAAHRCAGARWAGERHRLAPDGGATRGNPKGD
eukprot:g29215.t1